MVAGKMRVFLNEFLACYRQELFLLLPELLENREKLVHVDPNIFSRLVLNADTPIMIHADDGTVIALSKQWLKLTCYTAAELPTVGDWLTRAYGNNSDRIALIIRDRFDDGRG
jgi:hypothetical protein